jgi:Gly-Xaa carboxypeptidase
MQSLSNNSLSFSSTEMFDDLKPPGQDPHWEIFGKLHEFLEAKFPVL